MQDLEVDNPQDDILSGVRLLTVIGAAVFMGLLWIGGLAIYGYLAFDDVTPRLVAEANAKKEISPEQLQMVKRIGVQVPLDCDATVKQSVAGVVVRETCYHRATSARKWDAP